MPTENSSGVRRYRSGGDKVHADDGPNPKCESENRPEVFFRLVTALSPQTISSDTDLLTTTATVTQSGDINGEVRRLCNKAVGDLIKIPGPFA